MLESLYHLQYLIYTVAFDAYMRNRCSGYSYDEHFGGIAYVYLRGFGLSPGHSVYHRRPHPQTILALRRCLIPN
jgi:exodeoxyribonuclease V beta subunit